MPQDLLGHTVRDRVTGFSGVVVGHVEYLTGCNQALVQPRAKPDGEVPEGRWIDVQRVEADPHTPRIVLDNGATPGCDIAPPIR